MNKIKIRKLAALTINKRDSKVRFHAGQRAAKSHNGAEMVKKQILLRPSLVVFLGKLLVASVTQGIGVIRDDLERNIYIPAEADMSPP